jgi:S-adenosylmethionine hydrolase
VIIDLKGNKIVGLVSTFGDRPVGTLVALLDSSGLLTISIVNGNAARLTLTSVGDEIDITNQG